jgi:pectin methylesterase-like acyl-CoA thioesterase
MLFRFLGILLITTVALAAALPRDPDRIVVAADGSGDLTSIQAAIDKVQAHRTRPVEILVRAGLYEEAVRIPREKRFVHVRGEDRQRTIVAAQKNERKNPNAGWPARSVFVVEGDDARVENLTIRNTTPKGGSQAEALYVNADRVVVQDCDLFSFQDTVNLSGRVYLDNCYIEGDVDFAWGYGAVMLVRCELKAVHDGYYVQVRNPLERPGMIFVDCLLSAADETKRCWLARIEIDRFPASQAAFIRCRMGPHVPEAGWIVTGEGPRDRLRFREFDSRDLSGQPLDVSRRLAGSQQLNAAEAERLSDPRQVLGGIDGWDPLRPAR